MTCKELARRLEGTGITSLVAHPGLSVTDHFGKSDSENKLSSKLIETYANSPIGQSSESGAIPLEFACTAEQLEGLLLGFWLVTAVWVCKDAFEFSVAHFLLCVGLACGSSYSCQAYTCKCT